MRPSAASDTSTSVAGSTSLEATSRSMEAIGPMRSGAPGFSPTAPSASFEIGPPLNLAMMPTGFVDGEGRGSFTGAAAPNLVGKTVYVEVGIMDGSVASSSNALAVDITP